MYLTLFTWLLNILTFVTVATTEAAGHGTAIQVTVSLNCNCFIELTGE